MSESQAKIRSRESGGVQRGYLGRGAVFLEQPGMLHQPVEVTATDSRRCVCQSDSRLPSFFGADRRATSSGAKPRQAIQALQTRFLGALKLWLMEYFYRGVRSGVVFSKGHFAAELHPYRSFGAPKLRARASLDPQRHHGGHCGIYGGASVQHSWSRELFLFGGALSPSK